MKNLKLVSLFALVFLATGILAEKEEKSEKCSMESRWKEKKSSNSILDQDFGLSFGPEDFLSPFMLSPYSPFGHFGFRDYYRPWKRLAALTKDLGSTIKTDKDQFTINLDVQHFAPDEISVKAADGYVVIEAKHEEKKDDHGFISRQFVRRYALPEGTEPDTIVSQLSSDGVLTITAPRKAIEGPKERIVPITHTGPIRKEAVSDQSTCQSEACVTEE